MSDQVCDLDSTLGVFPPYVVHCSGGEGVVDIPQILSQSVGT